MLHIKDDINNLYNDSTNLNNIIDYVSAKLFKLRNNRNKIIKQEISKLNEEKHYKKLVKLKIKRGEIIQNKLFLKKSYLTDDYKIKKNLKAKLIYKNGYSSNSFKAMKNYIKSLDRSRSTRSIKKPRVKPTETEEDNKINISTVKNKKNNGKNSSIPKNKKNNDVKNNKKENNNNNNKRSVSRKNTSKSKK